MSTNKHSTRNTAGLAGYPNTGAFQHLPIRTTITGDAVTPYPNANNIFLRNLPAHCFTLPNVTLNFTIVEIIVLLPNWFKNKAIASRFMNNYLTANVHFVVFEEHRECKFASDHEREKAKKTITDEYRKAMRNIPGNRGWTKAKHVAPLGWDPLLLSMDGFIPDDTQFREYRRPPSILFRDLMIGVKKLPEGTNAGDLTRALQFALENPQDYMFPDDMPQILEYIGRTQITVAHTDRPIVRAYVDLMRKEADSKRPRRDQDSGPNREELIARSLALDVATQMQVQQQAANTVEELSHQPPQITVTDGRAGYQPQSTTVDRSSERMDALLQPHLNQGRFQVATPPASPPRTYGPHHLLRDCVEGNVSFDGSPLARAARFAQQPDQIGTEWYVENVPWLVQLLNAATQFEGGF